MKFIIEGTAGKKFGYFAIQADGKTLATVDRKEDGAYDKATKKANELGGEVAAVTKAVLLQGTTWYGEDGTEFPVPENMLTERDGKLLQPTIIISQDIASGTELIVEAEGSQLSFNEENLGFVASDEIKLTKVSSGRTANEAFGC